MSKLRHFPFSFGRVAIAYCSSVTVAAGFFSLKVSLDSGVFLSSWVVAFVLFLLPYAGAIVVARRFSVHSWWYFIGGAVATAAVACIPFISVVGGGHPLGHVPDTIPSLFESYLHIFSRFLLSGLMAGVVSWLFFRRWESSLNESQVQARASLTLLCHQMLKGELSFLEGAMQVCALRFNVGVSEFDPDLLAFVAIASETDHLPLSRVQHCWSSDALQQLQPEFEQTEVWAKGIASQACQNIIERFSPK